VQLAQDLRWLDAGINPKSFQQLLSHSCWSTTIDLVSHQMELLQREASEKIGGLLLF
jgi:hypothetical protein